MKLAFLTKRQITRRWKNHPSQFCKCELSYGIIILSYAYHMTQFRDMQVVHADPMVVELLENLYLLPQSRVARYAYLDHFQLRLDISLIYQ